MKILPSDTRLSICNWVIIRPLMKTKRRSPRCSTLSVSSTTRPCSSSWNNAPKVPSWAGYGEKAATSCSVSQGIFWMAISLPEDAAPADIENASVSRGFACACTRNVQCRGFAAASISAKARQNTNTQRVLMPIDCENIREFINGLTAILQPRKVFGLFRAS